MRLPQKIKEQRPLFLPILLISFCKKQYIFILVIVVAVSVVERALFGAEITGPDSLGEAAKLSVSASCSLL